MADHRLIAAYRHDLLTRLPAELAEEVSDGLTDAQEEYVRRGLSPDQAAAAAVAEFGHPGTVADAFRSASPVLRLARILIATGPVVGACWAATLITARDKPQRSPPDAPLSEGSAVASASLSPRSRAEARDDRWLVSLPG